MINKEYNSHFINVNVVDSLLKNIEEAKMTFGPSISTGQYNDSYRNINLKLKDEDSGEQNQILHEIE